MSLNRISIAYLYFTFLLLHLEFQSPQALSTDGVLLLSFKYSILNDPFSVLEDWNYSDQTPCLWSGVTCAEAEVHRERVTSLLLPNKQLLGSVSASLFSIPHLKHLDLSNNLLNGSLPDSAFNAAQLQLFSLSKNLISGQLPESINGMISLQLLNLSGNALAGKIPRNLTTLKNLTVVSLKSNHFSGDIPSRFDSVQVLDLSSNMLNLSIPSHFGGISLRYLNLSDNEIPGSIPPDFAEKIPINAIIDLSTNNLTGPIPESLPLLYQKAEFFSGNGDLCGKPLNNLCSIPSSLSSPPNATTISPAIAVIPRTQTESNQETKSSSRLQPSTIVGIIVADLAGLAILAVIALYLYQLKKRKTHEEYSTFNVLKECLEKSKHPVDINASPPTTACNSCLMIKGAYDETSTSDTTSSPSDKENRKSKSKLVTLDGETQLELESLLKASAYILGSSGSSIVYKAVLQSGTAFAVRRIGAENCAVEKFKEFESEVQAIAKLRHPNLVRVRGFCWGEDEKLLIYDYVPNGSLACSSYRKPASSSSPSHLPLEARIRIAKGLARALAFIHEKKHVHGNINPNNILLNPDSEPIITDLGLDHLINSAHKPSAHFRAESSQHLTGPSSPSVGPVSSPYSAPESRKIIEANPRWDVYSFGAVMLEVFAGRAFSSFCRELNQWSVVCGTVAEERIRLMRLTDVAIRDEVASNDEAMLMVFRLGFSCVSLSPQKRPSMKEVAQLLETVHAFRSGH